MTTGDANHPLGYYGVIADFYDESAERLAKHLDAGRTVVVLAEGDPLFYSSYMYLHDRLAGQFRCEVVPGVTSMTAAAAAAGIPLARHEDVLTVLPGTLPIPELARRLADTDAAVIMKLGRTFDGVREALRQAGRLESARYVERATTGGEHTRPVVEVDSRSVPYFSMIVVPGADRRQDSAGRHSSTHHRSRSKGPAPESIARPQLLVVGLGPGPTGWLTPEVSTALAEVDHVVGYGPYIDRIPARPGLRRHASGNTVELDRARFALDLVRSGERVAVVSGGDPGVFGMASAVFEAAADDRYAGITITGAAGGDGRPGSCRSCGCSTGRRLRRAIALGPPQALASDRGAAAGRSRRRSRPGHLQPRLTESGIRSVEARADSCWSSVTPRRRWSSAGMSAVRPRRLAITTLDDLDPATIDMSCLLIVGSSQTHVDPKVASGPPGARAEAETKAQWVISAFAAGRAGRVCRRGGSRRSFAAARGRPRSRPPVEGPAPST